MEADDDLVNTMASIEASGTAGSKVTNMGKKRKSELKDIISDGLANGDSIQQIAKDLKNNVSTKRDDRDWTRVARTEVTNAKGIGSLDLIIAEHGEKAKVYRETNNCCDVCAKLFGRTKKKIWIASFVPEKIKGAVHVNCLCKEWVVLANE